MRNTLRLRGFSREYGGCDNGQENRRSELSEIRLVDVVLPTKGGPEIRNWCVARLTEHQRILLEKLGLKLPTRIRESKM